MIKFFKYLFLIIICQIINAQNPIKFVTEVNKLSNDNYQLIINGEIEENWRLYSIYIEEGGAIPTEIILNITNANDYEISGNVIESPTVTKFDPIFGLDQTYFVEKNSFTQNIKINNKNLKKIFGKIAYQACDDSVCIFRESDLEFSLDGSSVSIINDDLSKLNPSEANPLLINLKNTEYLDDKSSNMVSSGNNLIDLIILGFLGGFLALLTPCVFPMIPLTVSFFNNKEKSDSSFYAVIYGFFIVSIFLLISLPFHFVETIDPEVLNTISTNAFLNVVFFLIFIFFAFSFFGFYDLSIPSSLISTIDSKSNSFGGFVGVFFMALTLVLVSFSCTGPILGTLLVGTITSQGGAIQLSMGMLGFGLALALPFTLFAFFPKMLLSLPKSGRWMNTFKVILGFFELAFAFKFLSNADLVQNWGLLRREIYIGIWIVISFLLFLYLLGVYKFPHESATLKRNKINFSLSLFCLVFAIYLIPAIFPGGSTSARLLSGFTPPSFYSIYPSKTDCPLNLNCFKDFNKGLDYAQKNDKPILLDFTGWACINCRRVEENVWTDPKIYDLIDNKYVLISLYVDDRKELKDEDKLELTYESGKIKLIETVGQRAATFQALNFKSASQPFYVLLDNDLTILNKPIQYTSKDIYLNWLEEGLRRIK
ncbi:MAG: hypothetical protein CMC72_03900 [Flavobacteriaceae bacterium]|nr:hypothetical protein [Flavobacteriaceae bacterium]